MHTIVYIFIMLIINFNIFSNITNQLTGCVDVVTSYDEFSGLNQMYYLVPKFVSPTFVLLKSRDQQSCIPYGDYRVESVSLSFLHSIGCLYSLAYGFFVFTEHHSNLCFHCHISSLQPIHFSQQIDKKYLFLPFSEMSHGSSGVWSHCNVYLYWNHTKNQG